VGYRRCSKKSALAPLHSDADAAAVLSDELNAGFLQGPLNRHRGASWHTFLIETLIAVLPGMAVQS
jgi:hypothetical protein